MSFYATMDGTCWRTVCAFPTKRLRDYMVAHASMHECKAKQAYYVQKMDEYQREGLTLGHPYNFLDMALGEYWEDELEPLWDETHDLGLW